MKKLLYLTLLLIGTGSLMCILTFALVAPSGDYEVRESTRAYLACQRGVARELRDPDSAQYAPWSEATIQEVPEGSHVWHIVAWVEADNGFGATLRENVYCEVDLSNPEVNRIDANLY